MHLARSLRALAMATVALAALIAFPRPSLARVAARRDFRVYVWVREASPRSLRPQHVERHARRLTGTIGVCVPDPAVNAVYDAEADVGPDGHLGPLRWAQTPPEWSSCASARLSGRRLFARTREGGLVRLRFETTAPRTGSRRRTPPTQEAT